MDALLRKIEADRLIHQNIDVGMVPHDRANRLRNICRRKHRQRNLVEQRLKKMIVLAVHHRDIDRQRAQGSSQH